MYKFNNKISSKSEINLLSDSELIELHMEVNGVASIEDYAKKMSVETKTIYAYKSGRMPNSFKRRVLKSLRRTNVFPYRIYTKQTVYFGYEVLACNELEAKTKCHRFHEERKLGKTIKVENVVDLVEIEELDTQYDEMLELPIIKRSR